MSKLQNANPHAAGIDVGSEKLFTSIAGDDPVIFGTFTTDVYALRDHLVEQGVTSVAMEATGIYWLYVYEVLEAAGLEVLMVNGKHVKNVPGRKTDMKDCQWIATLHSHGLLAGGFVPPEHIRRLQDYQRLRNDHITMAATHAQHMQKALERMNVKVHNVLSDLTGVSGMRIVDAILAGERKPKVLVELCDSQIKNRKRQQVIESLRGTWRTEHLFALEQARRSWQHYQDLIAECDTHIEEALKQIPTDHQPPVERAKRKGNKAGGKNGPQIDGLHQLLVNICGGKDATQLPAITDYSLLQLISETGTDMSQWKSEKHFTAWLGLAPGTHQSGKRRRNQKQRRNRAGQLFSVIARSLVRSVDKALGGFYRRLKGRRGGLVANLAMARKLAVLYYRLMRYGLDYVEEGLKAYQAKYERSREQWLAKTAKHMGYKLLPTTESR